MSEWLTTGEMIDRLKVGEVYELANPNSEWDDLNELQRQVTIWRNGHVKYKEGVDFIITKFIKHEAKWRKVPKYISFEEAMQALKNGKKVKVDNCTRAFDKNEDMEDSVGAYANWGDLLEGKWQIIE